jgi:Putative antitoxin of bacterial toxin-antitoxin system, YdaS/YdaT
MKKEQRAATDLAIKNMGGLVKTAARFSITLSAIGYWRQRGVPLKHLKAVVLEGKVAREKLRPDLYA